MEILKTFLVLLLLNLCLIEERNAEQFRVGITHYNDILGQFQSFKETSKGIQACGTSTDPGCIAGVPQLMGHIQSISDNDFAYLNYTSRLMLTPGNFISGAHGWTTLLEDRYSFDDPWKKLGKILTPSWLGYCFSGDNCWSYIRPNVTSLGVDEFIGGLNNLTKYLTEAQIRPVVSNIDCEKQYKEEDEKAFCSTVDRSRKLTLTGFIEPNNISYTIGVVGFVDPMVYHLAEPGDLEFLDTATSISTAISEDLGDVDFIIGLGTGSLANIKKIVDANPKIKLVIYGGKGDEAVEDYPLKYGDCIIATAATYGKSLGKLELDINMDNGAASMISGKLVLNNDAVPYYASAETEILSLAKEVSEAAEKEVALLKIDLQGSSTFCRSQECPIGRHIADSMIRCAFKSQTVKISSEIIAVWHEGGFVGSDFAENGMLKFGDTRKLLPFHNYAVLVSMTGSVLKEMFVASATGIGENAKPAWGQFLHVSRGVKVRYQENTDGTYSLASLKVLQKNEDGALELQEVNDSTNYNVVIPTAIYHGRSAFYNLPGKFASVDHYDKHDIAKDHVCLENYLMGLGVIGYSSEEERIIINHIEGPTVPTTPTTTTAKNGEVTSSDLTTTSTTTTTEVGVSSTTTTIKPTTKSPTLVPEVVCAITEERSTLQVALATAGLTTLFLFAIFMLSSAIYVCIGWRVIGSHRQRQFSDGMFTPPRPSNFVIETKPRLEP